MVAIRLKTDGPYVRASNTIWTSLISFCLELRNTARHTRQPKSFCARNKFTKRVNSFLKMLKVKTNLWHRRPKFWGEVYYGIDCWRFDRSRCFSWSNPAKHQHWQNGFFFFKWLLPNAVAIRLTIKKAKNICMLVHLKRRAKMKYGVKTFKMNGLKILQFPPSPKQLFKPFIWTLW